jgi:tRNA threonylcarbamoyladenosine biosynthesis protein TsaB
MLILGLDTTQSSAQIALVEEQHTLLATEVSLQRMESLPSVLAGLFELIGVCPERLGGVCFVTGPGNYTGIRAGLMVAKTFALRYRLPLRGISRLEAIVYRFKHSPWPVSPLLNVRQGQFYTALACWQHEAIHYLREPHCTTLSAWVSELANHVQPYVFLAAEALAEVPDWIQIENTALAAAHWMREVPQEDPLPPVMPFYIRPAVQGALE